MNRAKAVQTSVKGYVDDIAMQKEDEIINLNIIQMEKGLGTKDSKLNYANGYSQEPLGLFLKYNFLVKFLSYWVISFQIYSPPSELLLRLLYTF